MNAMNLADTIIPRSDQMNADDLIAGPMTITVTGVARGSVEQPVVVKFDGDGGRPYKPCKSMRRLLIAAWGDNGHDWVGKSMTLYNDPQVRFGGVAVGGIRISHVSHIERDMTIALTVTKGKREQYPVKVLRQAKAATIKPDLKVADDPPSETDPFAAPKVDAAAERAAWEAFAKQQAEAIEKAVAVEVIDAIMKHGRMAELAEAFPTWHGKLRQNAAVRRGKIERGELGEDAF